MNVYKKQHESHSIFFPYILIFASFLLIYIDDALSIYSPSILVSLSFLILYLMHGRLLVGSDFFIVLFLFTLSILMSENQSVKELFRLVYIYGGISLAFYYKNISRKLSINTLFLIFFLIFLLDLILRIFISSDLLNLSVYSIKGGGGLFSDSNYSGLLITIIIIELFERNKRMFTFSILIMFIFLLLTFSRTSMLMLIFYFFSIKFEQFSKILLVLLFCALLYLAYFPEILIFDVSLIDGSLNSKYFILQSFAAFTELDIKTLLFGLGRANEEFLEIYRWTGHTLFGQIVQYGFLQISLLLFLIFKYLKLYSSEPNAMFKTIFFGGIFSFFPSSYIGLIMLTISAIKFSRK